jgi:hypothetical protein
MRSRLKLNIVDRSGACAGALRDGHFKISVIDDRTNAGFLGRLLCKEVTDPSAYLHQGIQITDARFDNPRAVQIRLPGFGGAVAERAAGQMDALAVCASLDKARAKLRRSRYDSRGGGPSEDGADRSRASGSFGSTAAVWGRPGERRLSALSTPNSTACRSGVPTGDLGEGE